MQTCKKCGSSWNSSQTPEKCPFCGANLTEAPPPDSIEGILSMIIDRHGKDTLTNTMRFCALLNDYAPKYDDERELIKNVVNLGVGRALYDADGKPDEEKADCLRRCRMLVQKRLWVSEDVAGMALSWLAGMLGWSDGARQNLTPAQPSTPVVQAPQEPAPVVQSPPTPIQFTAQQAMYLPFYDWPTGPDGRPMPYPLYPWLTAPMQYSPEPEPNLLSTDAFEPPASSGEVLSLWCRAENGDAKAQYRLGWHYENGEGVARNIAVAAKWYRCAAEQGHTAARTALLRLNAR